MKSKHNLLIAAGLVLSAAIAGATNITIADNNTGTIVGGTPYTETSDSTSWYKGDSLTGPATEYYEVEPGMLTGSHWDLAAFVNPAAGRLGVLSGYDLQNGKDGLTIGDMFVSINPISLVPNPDPNYNYSQFTPNTFGYDFAVRFNFVSGTYTVFDLEPDTSLENGMYFSQNYNSASNPWRVAGPADEIASGNMFYTNNLVNATADSLAGFDVTSAYKYYLEVDTDWLAPLLGNNPQVLYKLTMECGNDNMLGFQTGGFTRVPDNATMISLLGMGLMALAGIARFAARRRA